MSPDIPPEVREALPGAGGSLIAAVFFKRPWGMRIALFCCGVIAAKFIGTSVAGIMGSTETVGGFVTGLFSMAIIEGLIAAIQSFDWSATLKRVVDAVLGRIKGEQ